MSGEGRGREVESCEGWMQGVELPALLQVVVFVPELSLPAAAVGRLGAANAQVVDLQLDRVVGENTARVDLRAVLRAEVIDRVHERHDTVLAEAVAARRLIRVVEAAETDGTTQIVRKLVEKEFLVLQINRHLSVKRRERPR